MLWLWKIVALGGLVIGMLGLRKHPGARLAVAAAGLCLGVLLLISALRPHVPLPTVPGINAYPHARGYVLGRTIVADNISSGEVVVLMFEGAGLLQDEVNRHLRAGLAEGLGAGFHLQVYGVRAPQAVTAGTEFDLRQFDARIRQDTGVVAIVSCVGVPQDAAPLLKKEWPPFYCDLIVGSPDWRSLVKSGALCSAVMALGRADRPNQMSSSLTWQEIFDSQYELVTPASGTSAETRR